MIFAFSSFGRNILSEYYIDKSTLFLSRSDLEKSVIYFQIAKRLNPDHPEVLFLQYKSAQSQKNEDKAYSFLEKAVNAGYNDIDAWYDLARLHNKYGNHDKEVLIYKKILQRNVNHPEANYCMAMYYYQELHDREKTIYHLKIARDNLPSDNIWRKRCDEILSQLEKLSP
jgi:tetratricopeptide (TPR) repeat protein